MTTTAATRAALAVVVGAAIGGCGATAPTASRPDASATEPFAAVAVVVLAAGAAMKAADGSSIGPATRAPSVDTLLAVLRSPDTLTETADALGQPVSGGDGGRGIKVAVEAEGERARLVVRAPERMLAIAACRAWIRAGDAALGRSDPAPAWLAAEIARHEHALAALDRQLELLPSATPLPLDSRDAALNAVRNLRVIAEIAMSHPTDTPSTALSDMSEIPGALERLLGEARGAEMRLEFEGRGPNHPDVQAASARVDIVTRLAAAQWVEEERAARVLEAGFSALPKRAGSLAVERAFATFLRAVDVEHASSSLPLSLVLLAIEHRVDAIDDEALAMRYGPRHPERLVVRARLDAVAAEFASARDAIAARLEAGLTPDGPDTRRAALRDEAAALAVALTRLEHARATFRPVHVEEREACHPR